MWGKGEFVIVDQLGVVLAEPNTVRAVAPRFRGQVWVVAGAPGEAAVMCAATLTLVTQSG